MVFESTIFWNNLCSVDLSFADLPQSPQSTAMGLLHLIVLERLPGTLQQQVPRRRAGGWSWRGQWRKSWRLWRWEQPNRQQTHYIRDAYPQRGYCSSGTRIWGRILGYECLSPELWGHMLGSIFGCYVFKRWGPKNNFTLKKLTAKNSHLKAQLRHGAKYSHCTSALTIRCLSLHTQIVSGINYVMKPLSIASKIGGAFCISSSLGVLHASPPPTCSMRESDPTKKKLYM